MTAGRFSLFLVLVLAVSLAAGACGGKLSAQIEPERARLAQARTCGAPFCTPEAFAAAEAYLDFAETADRAGNRMEAEVYLARAQKKITDVLRGCENCASDLDADGIPDRHDGDPYRAEDLDQFRDEDGIPDYDNDGDALLDPEDRCPNEAEDFDGFRDEDGCPDPDNDRDNIADQYDQCPNEPEDIDGFEDQDGCPDPDNDQDNIADERDLCPTDPETYNGFLDEDGCPDQLPSRRKFIPLPEVEFVGDSLALTYASRESLRAFADRLKKHPKLHVRIEGHTYPHGEVSLDEELTKKKAELVREMLISLGVEPNRVIALGFGATRPVADNETYAGRTVNDRIDFIIYLQ